MDLEPNCSWAELLLSRTALALNCSWGAWIWKGTALAAGVPLESVPHHPVKQLVHSAWWFFRAPIQPPSQQPYDVQLQRHSPRRLDGEGFPSCTFVSFVVKPRFTSKLTQCTQQRRANRRSPPETADRKTCTHQRSTNQNQTHPAGATWRHAEGRARRNCVARGPHGPCEDQSWEGRQKDPRDSERRPEEKARSTRARAALSAARQTKRGDTNVAAGTIDMKRSAGLRYSTGTGGLLKPDFGLSGAVRRLDKVFAARSRFRAVHSDSISTRPSAPVA